jgi:hypothetical protein
MDNKDDDDMPPELEDLSDELNKIRMTRGSTDNERNTEIKINVIEDKKIDKNNSSVKVPSSIEKSEEEFGSFMKKGFFKRSQNSKTNESNTEKKVENITYIKSGQEKKEPKIIENIKNEIKSNQENESNQSKNSLLNNIIDKKDEWLNQELLMKIAQKPNLMKSFMDPRFSEVITLMQKDPQLALQKYGQVKEFNDFIKEFSGIMAEHFGKLEKKETNKVPLNTQQFDKETEEIMKDPKISAIIYKLQTEGKIDVEEIQRDPYIAFRVKKLIEKGVFQVQRESELNK